MSLKIYTLFLAIFKVTHATAHMTFCNIFLVTIEQKCYTHVLSLALKSTHKKMLPTAFHYLSFSILSFSLNHAFVLSLTNPRFLKFSFKFEHLESI